MSNLKRDIDEIVKKCQVQSIKSYELATKEPLAEALIQDSWREAKNKATTQIINLIESVIKESMVKELGKLEHNKRFFHKGIHVVAVSSIEERLAGLKGEYIKSKLIDGEGLNGTPR